MIYLSSRRASRSSRNTCRCPKNSQGGTGRGSNHRSFNGGSRCTGCFWGQRAVRTLGDDGAAQHGVCWGALQALPPLTSSAVLGQTRRTASCRSLRDSAKATGSQKAIKAAAETEINGLHEAHSAAMTYGAHSEIVRGPDGHFAQPAAGFFGRSSHEERLAPVF